MRTGRWLIGLIALGMLIVLARVAQLQMMPPRPIARLLNSQRSRLHLLARRGTLTDRMHRPMATTRVGHRLFVDPLLINDLNTFAERVGYGLGYEPSKIDRKISGRLDQRYVVIDPRMSEQRFAKSEQLKVPGLAVEPRLVRDYPLGPLAGQVIGFVGADGRGLEGVELALDQRLMGLAGGMRYWRSAGGGAVWVEPVGYQAPIEGKSVRLSLDVMIQTIAEQQLAQACRKHRARAGELIVMQPDTGEILAMANYPPFDPNDFAHSTAQEHRNRCVTDVFEPGSTFKPFVWSMALEAGLIAPGEVFDCTTSGVKVFFGKRTLHDTRGHGKITADMVLIKSSNIGMGQIGQRMGLRRLQQALEAFGFGHKTGSGLPGEVPGLVHPPRQWNRIYSATSVPMGQEIAVTSLQLARAFCVFANGGYLVAPTIEARGPDYYQREVKLYERVLSPQVAAHARQVLRRVVTEGTGKRANSDRYAIFGKTGTAQVPDRTDGGYLEDQYTSGFMGAAPLDDPQLVVVCIIHQPDKQTGYYGGTVAAPPVRAVIERSLLYMGVPPDGELNQ